MLTREDLKARLRVPIRENETEQHSSFHCGFGLSDFEEIKVIRRGPGITGDDGEAEEKSCICEVIEDDEAGSRTVTNAVSPRCASPGEGSGDPAPAPAMPQHSIPSMPSFVQNEAAAAQPNVVENPTPIVSSGAEAEGPRDASIFLREAEVTAATSDRSDCKLAERNSPPETPAGSDDRDIATDTQLDGGLDVARGHGRSISDPSHSGSVASNALSNAHDPICGQPNHHTNGAPQENGTSRGCTTHGKPQRKMTRLEYEALLERLQGAQANMQTWTAEVESARKELEVSKARGGRYLEMLHHCYEQEAECQFEETAG